MGKVKRKKFKFDGFDYTEVFEAANQEYGVYPPLQPCQENFTDFEDEAAHVASEFERMSDFIGGDSLEKLMRRYLKAFVKLGKKLHYSHPIFEGVCKIKDQETFLKYCAVLFSYMWN